MKGLVKENTEAFHRYLKEIEENLYQSQSQDGEKSNLLSLYKKILDPKKSFEDKKIILGKQLTNIFLDLYPSSNEYSHSHIIGKILELDNSEILLLIENNKLLMEKIDELEDMEKVL